MGRPGWSLSVKRVILKPKCVALPQDDDGQAWTLAAVGGGGKCSKWA